VLIARIYEVFPLLCPLCGGQMRLIAFITNGAEVRKILEHIGVDCEPPHITPARGPPLWEECDAQTGSKPSQTGIWRRNRHPTMRSTDKSIGERMKRRLAGLGVLPKPQVHRLAAG
jgi:hypothetical protein